MMHAIRCFVAFVSCALVASTVSAAPGDPVLVIAGASYAKSWGKPRLPGYEVVNTGKGGDETQQVLARFDEVLAAKPAAVILWGHINNIHRAPAGQMEAAKERAKANFREMIDRARSNGIVVIIGTEVTLSEAVGFMNRLAAFVGSLRGKEGYAAKINKEVRAVNEWLRGYARQNNLQVLDFEKVFDDGEGFRRTEFTDDDGTHITKEGYAALTKYAASELTRR
jgi:lysophospholipase L1-like esterase